MKYIFGSVILGLAVASISLSFANFQDSMDGYSTSQYTSVRNLPVIMENETLANGRCRLHFDTGVQMDVSCNREAPQS